MLKWRFTLNWTTRAVSYPIELTSGHECNALAVNYEIHYAFASMQRYPFYARLYRSLCQEQDKLEWGVNGMNTATYILNGYSPTDFRAHCYWKWYWYVTLTLWGKLHIKSHSLLWLSQNATPMLWVEFRFCAFGTFHTSELRFPRVQIH